MHVPTSSHKCSLLSLAVMPGLSQQAYTRGKKVDLPSDAASNACARSARASPGRRRRASRVLRVWRGAASLHCLPTH